MARQRPGIGSAPKTPATRDLARDFYVILGQGGIDDLDRYRVGHATSLELGEQTRAPQAATSQSLRNEARRCLSVVDVAETAQPRKRLLYRLFWVTSSLELSGELELEMGPPSEKLDSLVIARRRWTPAQSPALPLLDLERWLVAKDFVGAHLQRRLHLFAVDIGGELNSLDLEPELIRVRSPTQRFVESDEPSLV